MPKDITPWKKCCPLTEAVLCYMSGRRVIWPPFVFCLKRGQLVFIRQEIYFFFVQTTRSLK